MPRDASGNMTRTNGSFNGDTTWGQQAASPDKTISSSRHDTHDQDMADEMTDSLSRSGKGAMSSNLAMNNNRITGLGNAIARGDAVTAGQIQDNGLTYLSNVGGTGDAVTADATPAIPAYVDGQSFQIQLANTNATEGVTIAINGLSAIPVKTGNGADIPAGGWASGAAKFIVIAGGGTQAIDPFTVVGSTGDIKITIDAIVPAGWLSLNGDTLGSAASGATQASDSNEALWKLFYDSMADSEAPVSGGRTTRDADWTANKTLTMVDARSRGLVGTGQGSGLTDRVNGVTGGEEDHTQTIDEMPAHKFTVGPLARRFGAAGEGSGNNWSSDVGTSGSTGSNDTNTLGNDDPFNVMHPFLALNVYVKI